jgi:soluble lytic murein transglycosylase-like protein
MNPENQHSHLLSPLNDLVVFLVTVAVCTFSLTAACTLSNKSEIITYATPVPAMPQPPESLEPAIEAESGQPGIEMAVALPAVEAISAGDETIAEKISVPDRPLPREHTPFHGIIVQVAGRYEVDPNLIRAIIFAESGYNPRAKSKKGARGLMQLMPSTAKSLGVEDIYDPEENIDGGVRYFRSLLDRFDGDVQLALAAYNAGSRHVRNYEGIPPFKATRHYIQKVLKFHEKFKMQKSAGSRRLA